MPMLIKNSTKPNIIAFVISTVFFCSFYLFLRFCIGTELIYYYFEMCRKNPFFKTGWQFFYDCLAYPGGLTQYVAVFVTQLYSFPSLGPLAITLLALGIFRLTASLCLIAPDSPWRIIPYIPAVLILMAAGRYENPSTIAVAILIVAFFALLYQRTSPRLGRARVILFLIFSLLLYYIIGSASLIFIILAALYELFNRRKPALGLLFLILGSLACRLLGAFVFKLDESELYLSSLPFVPIKQILENEKFSRYFEWLLFAFLPVVVLVHSAFSFLHSKFQIKKSVTQSAESTEAVPAWVIQTFLLFLIAVPAVAFSYDWKAKRTLQVCYFTRQRMWPEALAVARKGSLKKYFPFCSNAVNRALYYSGRLGDEMFAYPQNERNSDLLFCKIGGPGVNFNVNYMERPELCLELGLTNVAEEIACQFLAGTKGNPHTLMQLAMINIVKGRPETTKIYLNALTKNLAYRDRAADCLRRLETDPRLDNDPCIQNLRQVSINKDITYITYDEGPLLEELLRQNKNNKMAFEYLMAHYLLNKNLDKFVENLPRLDNFGYKKTPCHYQEAILLYVGITQKDVPPGQRVIDIGVKEKYDKILEINRSMGNNPELLKKALAQQFGDTYFFYFTFGCSEPKQ